MNISCFKIEFNEKKGQPFFAKFPFVVNGIPVEGISCCLSSRFAGDMKIGLREENRRALFGELGINPEKVYGLKQVHSRDVLVIDGKHPPGEIWAVEADGMVTRESDVYLSVTVADCLPVFLFDTRTKALSLVHSGWKGTGIALNALNLMIERFGSKPGGIAAVLGPCIGNCCYRVDENRALSFEKEFGGGSVRKESGEFFLDLKGANIKLLNDAGVENIAVCENCTFCDGRLGSFRREGEKFIHMLAIIGNF